MVRGFYCLSLGPGTAFQWISGFGFVNAIMGARVVVEKRPMIAYASVREESGMTCFVGAGLVGPWNGILFLTGGSSGRVQAHAT